MDAVERAEEWLNSDHIAIPPSILVGLLKTVDELKVELDHVRSIHETEIQLSDKRLYQLNNVTTERDELKRNEEILERWNKAHISKLTELEQKMDRETSENARLRAALETIAEVRTGSFFKIERIANEALREDLE